MSDYDLYQQAELQPWSHMSEEETLEQIKVMVSQEDRHYQCTNYFQVCPQVPSCSPLSVVAECAMLVTDLPPPAPASPEPHTASVRRLKRLRAGGFTSPTSSMDDVRKLQQEPSLYASHGGLERPNSSRSVADPCGPGISSCMSASEVSSLTEWRYQMLDWARLLVESYHLDPDVVAIAFHILDRYIASILLPEEGCFLYDDILLRQEDYQLYAMVCIYIAIKSVVPARKLTVECLQEMSRGFYSAQDITEAELEILNAIQWHVNPPTVMDFCRHYWILLPKSLQRDTVLADCQFLSERAIQDPFFVGRKGALVALVIVLLTIQRQGVTLEEIQCFLRRLQGLVNVQEAEFDTLFRQLECVH